MANTLESIINLPQLNSESTLGELPLIDFQVSPMTSVELVASQLNKKPDLPGVLVVSDQKFLGMISRRCFFEQMSSPYGRELFIKRPINYLLKAAKCSDNCLILPAIEKINLAVQFAFNRAEESVYEPLVIQILDRGNQDFPLYFLLSFQTLILAQSHIVKGVNNELSRYKTSAKKYLMQLQDKQHKLQEHTAALQVQKQEILARNTLLEKQQNELISQSQQIKHLNQRLKEITCFISQEGKKAFYATFEGVTEINKNMNKIVGIGQLFTNELKLINFTSNKIETISQQASHLALQAAIVAGHSSTELSGFSHITSEIGKLVSETSEAGRHMNLVADNLMMKIYELNDLAETGKNTAQFLVENNQRAEKTLDELEALIQQPNLDKTPINLSSIAEPINTRANPEKNLINNPHKKLGQAEQNFADLTGLNNSTKDKENLVQKINSTLSKKLNTQLN